TNPYEATIGLRVEPAADGAGYSFALDVPHDAVPLHIYKRRELFADAMRDYVGQALEHGRYGWPVTDCTVTLTECFYAVWDGPPSRRGSTSLADFKKLTPLVVKQALEASETVVCEPVVRARVEVPTA